MSLNAEPFEFQAFEMMKSNPGISCQMSSNSSNLHKSVKTWITRRDKLGS